MPANNLYSQFILSLIILFFLPLQTYADDKAEVQYADLEQRYEKLYSTYHVNEDMTVEISNEVQVKVLTERAVNALKSRRLSFSTSVEKLDIVEAFTLKADGTKIDVPEGNYQVKINKGNEAGDPIFSDRTSITVIFPELEVNDSVVMKTRLTQTEPMFPGHFSTSQSFWTQSAYDDVRIILNLPESLRFKHQVREMAEKQKIKKGRKIIQLTYQNKKPIKDDRIDFSVWDEETVPGFAISTFDSYEAIAEAYGARALPKAKPDDRVKKLVEKVIGDETDKLKQARMLYDWVATNISYAGNCIGVGAVVPRDTGFILDNKMGDCKDHATLLEAMLTVVGIDSTQALINSGAVYELSQIPLVTSVNHVLTYIPQFDQFVDSTSSTMPFDMLPFSVSDKPVLLVKNHKDGLKTPPLKIGSNRQQLATVMKIQSDGSVTGSIDIKLTGRPAVAARDSWRHASEDQIGEWIKNTFSSQGKIGSGTMQKDDPVPLMSEFKYSFEFNRPEYIPATGAGGFYIFPVVNTPAPIYTYVNYPKEEIDGYRVSCGNGYSREEYIYEFPENMKILAQPESFEVEENHLHYKASYALEGNQLKVVREIDDATPGNVCSAELMNAQRKTLMKITENLKSQVVFQYQ